MVRLRSIAGCVAILALALSLPASATAAPVPLAEVGSAGSGAGQLINPKGVALDGAGNLYVAEQNNHRISVFGADGTFIRAFGWGVDTGGAAFEVCTTASVCLGGSSGGGAGQLSFPRAVALDGAGGLYVADANNQRISAFSTAGPSFTRAFGWGVDTGAAMFEVCTTATTCQTGIFGGGAGQLNNPLGVALDGAGGLHVADENRIAVFGTAGPSFTHAFGWGVDTGGAAFEVCTTASICQTGIFGGGAGQLASPQGVATDCRGAAWVADSNNDRLQRFGEPGTALPPCTGPSPPAGPSAPAGPAKKKCKKGQKLKKGKCVKKKKRKRKKK